MAEWKLCLVLLLPLTLCFDSEVTEMKTIGREPDVTPICTNATEHIIALIVCRIRTERREECRLLYQYGEDFVFECDPRFTLMMENQTVFLHLTSLTPVDSGNYTCECSHPGGTYILHLNITVEEEEDTDMTIYMQIPNVLIGATVVITITAAIVIVITITAVIWLIYRGIRHRRQSEPLSSLPNTEPEDIEPYSTYIQRESGLYSTVRLHNCNNNNISFSLALFLSVSLYGFKGSSEAELKESCVFQWKKMLLILILTALLFKASTSQITGYGNKTADYGGEAHYSCAVANPTGVLQVTWQRLINEEVIENLATYSERFGQQVNDPDRVIFTEASLGSTSITLRNVTWGDEACYICSFNVYPDGSKRKQTCLTVQGISKVRTKVQRPSSDREDEDVKVVFSCSATGKPAPTIHWDFPPGATSTKRPLTSTETNGDHTFTSSRNVTLQVPAGWTGHVDCLLNRGAAGQRRERIPFSLPARKKEEEGKGLSSSEIGLVITAVVFISLILVAAVATRKRLKGSRRNENV
ncbi:uncharacterized protein [Cebidichthys violaceus]|uniref:uncharacterized protein n=1 Tax=Cebidichthys violaceus TaxID=271503 RepID=UPI0035CA697A